MRGIRGRGDVGCEIALSEARESETMTKCLVRGEGEIKFEDCLKFGGENGRKVAMS